MNEIDKRAELFRTHGELCQEAYVLMEKKNADYGTQGDPFHSFRMFGALGILVRMGDKLSRLTSFQEKGFNAVASESVRDTVIDMINYSVLYLAYLEETNQQ